MEIENTLLSLSQEFLVFRSPNLEGIAPVDVSEGAPHGGATDEDYNELRCPSDISRVSDNASEKLESILETEEQASESSPGSFSGSGPGCSEDPVSTGRTVSAGVLLESSSPVNENHVLKPGKGKEAPGSSLSSPQHSHCPTSRQPQGTISRPRPKSLRSQVSVMRSAVTIGRAEITTPNKAVVMATGEVEGPKKHSITYRDVEDRVRTPLSQPSPHPSPQSSPHYSPSTPVAQRPRNGPIRQSMYADFDPNQFTSRYGNITARPSNSRMSVGSEDSVSPLLEYAPRGRSHHDNNNSNRRGSIKDLQERRKSRSFRGLDCRSVSPRATEPAGGRKSHSSALQRVSLSVDRQFSAPNSRSQSPRSGTTPTGSRQRSVSLVDRGVEQRGRRVMAEGGEGGEDGEEGRKEPSRPTRRSSVMSNLFRRTSKTTEKPADLSAGEGSSVPPKKRRSTLTKIADVVVSTLSPSSATGGGKAGGDDSAEAKAPPTKTTGNRRAKKQRVALNVLPAVQRQQSHPPAFILTNGPTEEEEEEDSAVIHPLPLNFMPPKLTRLGSANWRNRRASAMLPGGDPYGRSRRNSIMPTPEPAQVMIRKMSGSNKDDGDGPKIDDVVFTVNHKGEMEMFEVITVNQPAHPPGRIKEVQSMEEFESGLLSAEDSLVCVTFSAKWCGPWRMIKPDVHRLSHIHGDVIFYEVDVDENEDIASARRVICMPTFQFFKWGSMLDKFAEPNRIKLDETLRKLKKYELKV